MKLVLLAVVCFAALCAVEAGRHTDSEYQSAFTEWQRTHNKAFSSDEFLPRFTNFKNVFDYVHDHNAKNLSWTAGLNQFSHLTNAEFRAAFLINLGTPSRSTEAREYTGEGERTERVATVDWRARGKVTPIKNQGSCGSCWTFAATAAIESAWAIKTGKLPVLSEQQLLDCTSSSYGCNGGWPQDALTYIKNAGGHDTSASYTYKTVKGTCAYNPSFSAATVSATNMVGQSEALLTSALNIGPTVVCFDAGQPSFQSYKSGIYNDPACTQTLNHAVTAVGYGNDGAGDYYIIKNSWGTGWGQAGYFQLARNAGNRCGVMNVASFPSTTGTGNRV